MGADAGDAIRRRDEILQVMFWLRGEGLAEAAGPGDLEVFLTADALAALAGDLHALARSGLVEPAGGGRYRLTDAGMDEGGRRFADEFDGMTNQGHGACNDPLCDCRALGPEACAHADHASH